MAIKTYSEDKILKFDKVFTEKNFRSGYKHVRRGKKLRDKTISYHMNHFSRLRKLYESVDDESYTIGALSKFTVYEPKEREVVADLFEDKIVQDVVAKHVLRPLIGPKLIYDNYASQPNKGTHMALERLKRYCLIHAKSVDWTDEGWVMIGDISKFFYNIDHTVMWQLLDNLPIDLKLKRLLRDQIDICNAEINPYSDRNDKGLCIGFQVSQWMAIYYLNKLDHYIKEVLGIKCYGRYMDDFFIIHKDKEYLEECFEKIKVFVETELFVSLNKKSYIHPFSQGICFLGYHVTYNPTTHQVDTKIRTKSINRMLHRAKIQKRLLRDGKITQKFVETSVESWKAYAFHGETEKAQNAYDKAKKILNIIYNPIQAYVEMCQNPDNVDPDGYFILHPRQGPGPDDCVRDSEGYAILIPRKQTKQEYVNAKRREEVLRDPEKYINSNLAYLLGLVDDRPKRVTKKDRARSKLHQSQTSLLEPLEVD